MDRGTGWYRSGCPGIGVYLAAVSEGNVKKPLLAGSEAVQTPYRPVEKGWFLQAGEKR